MNFKSITFFAIAFSAVLFTSCETCMTCEYEKVNGDLFSEEVCGDDAAVEGFQKEVEDSAEVNRAKFDCWENY